MLLNNGPMLVVCKRVKEVKYLISFTLLFLVMALPCSGSICNIEENYLTLQKKNISDLIPLERHYYLERLDSVRVELATCLYQSYKKGILPPFFLSENLPENKNRKIYKLLSRHLKKSIFNFLAESNSRQGNELIEKVKQTIKDRGGGFVLQTVGHTKQIDLKGGIHRSKKSIFLQLDLMDYNELIITFIHELVHYQDEKLTKAEIEYFTMKNRLRAHRVATDDLAGKTLSKEDIRFARTFVLNGLNAGIFSEVLAFTKMFELYQELKGYKELSKIDWIEEILDHSKDKSLKELVYQVLLTEGVPPSREEGEIYEADIFFNLYKELSISLEIQ